jgi:hypothetical protein
MALDPLLAAAEARLLELAVELFEPLEHALAILCVRRRASVYAGSEYRQSRK